VLELGILLAVLMGWQFTLAEFIGGPLMITILVLLFKVFLTRRLWKLLASKQTRAYRVAWRVMPVCICRSMRALSGNA
jgi:high-affinity Fe2+/Pb2+ permease